MKAEHHADDLAVLRRRLPELAELLAVQADLGRWTEAMDRRLLPRLAPGFPLVAAVCGGGSTGKSTLFNTLAGRRLSPAGATAGLNRRVVMAAHPDTFAAAQVLETLSHLFGQRAEPLQSPDQALSPGPAVWAPAPKLPPGLVLLDTPDFDTGAGGRYTNRQAARPWLEAADVLVYVFTNTTYANRDNTDFLAHTLTGLGMRPCLLVYRIYASVPDELAGEHTDQVARALYGHDADRYVLGRFRMDEDNQVALANAPACIRPQGAAPALVDTLARLDGAALRRAATASLAEALVAGAQRVIDQARDRAAGLSCYIQALQAAQAACVTQALASVPVDALLHLLVRTWKRTDPPALRWMRSVGAALAWPVDRLARALGAAGGRSPGPEQPDDARQTADLLAAAERLLRLVRAPALPAEPCAGQDALPEPAAGDTVAVAPCLQPLMGDLLPADHQKVMDAVAAQAHRLLAPTEALEAEMQRLCMQWRGKMGWADTLRQSLAAALNALPATAAVTYVLHTADPVGAAALKLKLTGLLGAKDLYALVALPASSGAARLDRAQLSRLLEPVARIWLEDKLAAVDRLFSRLITGRLAAEAARRHQAATSALEQAQQALDRLLQTKDRP